MAARPISRHALDDHDPKSDIDAPHGDDGEDYGRQPAQFTPPPIAHEVESDEANNGDEQHGRGAMARAHQNPDEIGGHSDDAGSGRDPDDAKFRGLDDLAGPLEGFGARLSDACYRSHVAI